MPLGKFFFIESKVTDLVLEVEGDGKEPGTRVIMLPKKEGLPQDQLWWEDHITGCIRSDLLPDLCLSVNTETQRLCIDTFSGDDPMMHWITTGDRLQCRSDQNKVLEVVDNSEEEGTELTVSALADGLHQKWDFSYQEARIFRIHSDLNGKALGYEGLKLKMFDYKGKPTQHWYEDKHGILYNAEKGLCMDSTKGYGKSLSLEFFEAGRPEQMWIKSGNKLINQTQPGQVLAIKNRDTSEGAKVIVREYKNNNNQHWKYQYLEESD